MREGLKNAKRIVIKLGTNMLSIQKDHSLISQGRSHASPIDSSYLHSVAGQIAELLKSGKEVIIVTSGAIGMGARELGLDKRVTDIEMRQACASIGQPMLMEEYRKAFGVFGITVAQLLVTRDDWNSRQGYLNLRASVETLLGMKVIPIFNENDSVSTAEIGNAFGDNDQLSAYVASKVDAEFLVILTDIDALYDSNPRENPDAKALHYVAKITPEILEAAGGRGSEFSTGGMATKIKAVQIARDAGCRVALAHGRTPQVFARLLAGEELGTLFEADEPLRNRTRWIKHASPRGKLVIDSGALAALKDHNSLLPKGVTSVEGVFNRGDVLLVNDTLKLVSSFNSDELQKIKGKHSSEVLALLGQNSAEVIARPEDMVFL